VSVSHVYYWPCLNHVEVEYEITANDAKNITSAGTVASTADPALLSASLPNKSGAGTIDANMDVTDKLILMSDDSWKTDITLNYTLNGAARTLSVSDTRVPEIKGLLNYSDLATGTFDDASGKFVYSKTAFKYPKDERHTYDVDVTGISIGWMRGTETSDGSYEFTETGSTRVLWDGTGTSPIEKMEPMEDGDEMEIVFLYEGTPDLTPPEDARGATHFYLIYEIEGTGTDTDGTVYRIADPTGTETAPAWIEEPVYNEPTISVSGVYLYTSLRHAEVRYSITANDATNIKSQAEISCEWGSYYKSKCTLPEMTGSGDFTADANYGDNLQGASGSTWETTIYMSYNLGSSSRTRTFSISGRPEIRYCYLDFASDYYVSDDITDMSIGRELKLVFKNDDPHKYTAEFNKVEIEWFKYDSYGNEISVGRREIWEGSFTEGEGPVFYGPYGPMTDTEDSSQKCYEYSFWYTNLNATPPDPEAVLFRLHFYGKISGNDSYDTSDELYAYTEEYMELP